MRYLQKPVFTCIQTGAPCKWTNESQRLILLNFDTIRDSPANIYHDALPFSPSSSWLHKCYTAKSLQAVKVVKGSPDKWGTCSRVVSLDHSPEVLACHKDIVTVGLSSGDIIVLDAFTGTRRSVFSGHTDGVTSLAFSLDGTLLASGSKDNTVKLWDIQTGGAIETFHSDVHRPCSLSISPDALTIASGSHNNAVCLWDIRTKKCDHVIEQCIVGQEGRTVTYINFIPDTPRQLVAASEAGFIQHLDVGGSKIGLPTRGDHIAFSSDGSRFVLQEGRSTVVKNSGSENSGSGTIVAFLPPTVRSLDRYCLSPNGEFAVGVSNTTAYVWDITNPAARLVETFTLHDSNITSLAFSSSLISASSDRSVRFWQVGGSSPNQVTTNARSAAHASAGVTSITLQEDTVISIDLAGVVTLWDLTTGQYKASFQTFETDGGYASDARLVGGVLTVAFCGRDSCDTWKITTWDVERDDRQTVALPLGIQIHGRDLWISGDGTRAFGLDAQRIQTWSTSTGKSTGVIQFERPPQSYPPSFILDGSRVWIRSGGSPAQGWDLRNPRSPPLPLSDMPADKHRLGFIQADDTKGMNVGPARIEDITTGEEVFRLPERFAQPSVAQWNGRYLAAAYNGNGTGELLVLDFTHMTPP